MFKFCGQSGCRSWRAGVSKEEERKKKCRDPWRCAPLFNHFLGTIPSIRLPDSRSLPHPFPSPHSELAGPSGSIKTGMPGGPFTVGQCRRAGLNGKTDCLSPFSAPRQPGFSHSIPIPWLIAFN
uniref:HDC06247 n=1 Tax=Drosophila melanogaster TaxID=7227 RepID=Q6IGI0_DROME|nr:TPA_inf: HDC06247 [Drosophila melanogaster]